MELNCHTCDQPIIIENHDWERLSVECPNCQSWNAYSPSHIEAMTQLAETYRLNEFYIDFLRRLIINRTLYHVKLEVPSYKVQTEDEKRKNLTGKVMSFILIVGGLLPILMKSEWAGTDYADYIFTFCLAILLCGLILAGHILYNSAAYIIELNYSVLDWYLQLPIGLRSRHNKVNVQEYKQFYVRKVSFNNRRGTFGLYGISRQANEHELIIEGAESMMLLVESELERLLKITDAPVSSGLANPYQKTVSADAILDWVTGIRVKQSNRDNAVEANVPISFLDDRLLADKGFQLAYADDAFIDFARQIKVQQSDELCSIKSTSNIKTYRGFRLARAAAVGMFLILGCLFFIDFFLNFNNSYIAGFAFAVPGLLFSKYLIDWLLNKQVVLIDQEHLYHSARPYPSLFSGRKMLKIEKFKQYYVRPVTRWDRLKGEHALYGIDRENLHFRICHGSKWFMLALESELERFLKIKDIPIGGSLSNPYRSSSE